MAAGRSCDSTSDDVDATLYDVDIAGCDTVDSELHAGSTRSPQARGDAALPVRCRSLPLLLWEVRSPNSALNIQHSSDVIAHLHHQPSHSS